MFEFAVYIVSMWNYMLPCPSDSMSSWYHTKPKMVHFFFRKKTMPLKFLAVVKETQ